MYIFFLIYLRDYIISLNIESLLVFLDKTSYWTFILWGNVKLDDKSSKHRKHYKDITFFSLKHEKQRFRISALSFG